MSPQNGNGKRAVELPIRNRSTRPSQFAASVSKVEKQPARKTPDKVNMPAILRPRERMKPYFKTKLGQIIKGDSLEYMASLDSESIDLIVTSPPFGLVRKKKYGNVESHEYVDWFKPFGREFKRLLKPTGSLVIDIGGAWIPGQKSPEREGIEREMLL